MAYREHTADKVFCHRHTSNPASVACTGCLEPLCDSCVVFFGSATSCRPCAKRLRTRRAIGRASLGLGVVVVAVAIGLFARSVNAQFDYGAKASQVHAARNKIDKERCDRDATLEYEKLLLDAGDNRGAIADVDAFGKACGDWFRVHWNSYEAYRRLSQSDKAVVEATKLIEQDPNDADYRWWRAVAYEDLVQYAEAERDYREALRLRPGMGNIPFNLASLLEREGRPCDAKQVVEDFVQAHFNAANDDSVMARLARLSNDCKP